MALTHALVNLQRRRNAQRQRTSLSEEVALTLVKEIRRGNRGQGQPHVLATLGPISDEIAIYPVASHTAWRR